MSVAQVQEILRGALSTSRKDAQPRGMALYFTYGAHVNLSEFKEMYPGAQPLGIGFLDNWTWHINSLGEANIRPSLIRSKAIIVKGPTIFPMLGTGAFEWTNPGTFGTIFAIPSEVEDSLDKKYCGSRVKMCLGVKIVISHPGIAPTIRKLDCITHYDARNTADGSQNIWMGDLHKKNRWLYELASLRKAGVRNTYISEMSGRLEGHSYEAEPIDLANVEIKLPKTEVDTPNHFLSFGSAESKSHRVHKHTALPIKRQVPGNAFRRSSSPEYGPLAHEERQYFRFSPANHPVSQQGRHSTLSARPLRRREATVTRPLPSTRHPQVRSRSAAAPERFQALLSSVSPDYPRGQYGEVSPTATHRQTTQLPREASSWAAHAYPAVEPAVKIEPQDEE